MLCAKCNNWGIIETYDKDPNRICNAGPATPAFKHCSCEIGEEALDEFCIRWRI